MPPRCNGAAPVLCWGEKGGAPVIFVRPDFYDGFQCIASRCHHSCCVGWEIDIDPEALARWREIGGAFGAKLLQSIATARSVHIHPNILFFIA